MGHGPALTGHMRLAIFVQVAGHLGSSALLGEQ